MLPYIATSLHDGWPAERGRAVDYSNEARSPGLPQRLESERCLLRTRAPLAIGEILQWAMVNC